MYSELGIKAENDWCRSWVETSPIIKLWRYHPSNVIRSSGSLLTWIWEKWNVQMANYVVVVNPSSTTPQLQRNLLVMEFRIEIQQLNSSGESCLSSYDSTTVIIVMQQRLSFKILWEWMSRQNRATKLGGNWVSTLSSAFETFSTFTLPFHKQRRSARPEKQRKWILLD